MSRAVAGGGAALRPTRAERSERGLGCSDDCSAGTEAFPVPETSDDADPGAPELRSGGNSPFDGVEGQGWFRSWHGFTRSLHLHEHDVIDEAVRTRWDGF